MTDEAQMMRGAITAILAACDRKGLREQALEGLAPDVQAEVLKAERHTLIVREEGKRWREAGG